MAENKGNCYASLFDLLEGVDALQLLQSGPVADGEQTASTDKQLRDIFRGAEGDNAKIKAAEARVLRPANTNTPAQPQKASK